MLEIAWSAAREWAVEAKRQQAAARWQARATLCLAALAAVLAAIAAATGSLTAPWLSISAIGTPIIWFLASLE